MSIKNENIKIFITDMLTGQNIDTINLNKYRETTILQMIIDIIVEDMKKDKNGIMIKYGY